MLVFGYVKQYKYTGDGTLLIQVRIPVIHGPYTQKEYNGLPVRNYVSDENLPWYQSVILPHLPNVGEVVALVPMDDGKSDFVVVGVTGGSYQTGSRV